MDAKPRSIKIYTTEKGDTPYLDWLNGLKDLAGRAKVRIQMDRLTKGNLGKARFLGGGLAELKIDFGPGYRVYFGEAGSTFVILLCGGDKSTQSRDIELAKKFWSDFRRRNG